MTTNNQKTQKEKIRNKQIGNKLTLDHVQKDFAACSRCSFFLAGYRVLNGAKGLEEAIAASDGEWLILQWNGEIRHLMQKSFGCQMDMNWYHFETCCPICYRRFNVTLTLPEPDEQDAPESETEETAEEIVPELNGNKRDEPGYFRVQLIQD